MSASQVTVGPLTDADVPAVIDLTIAQETRWHSSDPRLERPHERPEIASRLAALRQEKPQTEFLVAWDGSGRACGYAQPALFELPPDSDLLAYFRSSNGTCERLVLPAPDEDDASAVLAALIAALTARWQQQHTLADMITWPSTDAWVAPLLKAHGFEAAHVLNHRPVGPLATSTQLAATDLKVRQAQPSDEDDLVALNRANVAHDASYSPFITVVPTLEPALRAQLGRLWAGGSVEDGVPLVLVVEHEGTLVGMAQTYLEMEPGFGGSGSLPRGRYTYLHEVIVYPEWRGKGVGRLLVQGVMGAYAALDVTGYTLYFSPFNPLSSTFWPHLGFSPVLTTYMRQPGQSEP
jgi:GNAT superfamily N-acetyltransferase